MYDTVVNICTSNASLKQLLIFYFINFTLFVHLLSFLYFISIFVNGICFSLIILIHNFNYGIKIHK